MSSQKSVYEMVQEMNKWRTVVGNMRVSFNTNMGDVLKGVRQMRQSMIAATTISGEVARAMRSSAYEFTKDYREFRKNLFSMREDWQKVMQSVTPYASLYSEIMESLDEETYEKINDMWEEEDNQEGDLEEELDIKRPYFYIAAVNLNIYKNVTEMHFYGNNATEEEVIQWKKYIAPLLGLLMNVFLAWALSDTPIKDMNFVKQMNRVMEIINEHPSEEKIDIDTVDDKTNDLNKTDIKGSFPS